MTLLIIFFLLAILVSFLCSIWEAVLLSVTPSFIKSLQQRNNPLGDELAKFKLDIDRPLSAILTLNTIAHTVGAIGVGAQAGVVFGDGGIDILGFTINYEAIIATVMTLLVLVLSEIIPKTLGANLWKQLSPFTVKSLKAILLVLAPFVWISQLITKSLKKDKNKSVLSRQDFVAMASVAAESGEIDENESNIINNLLKFNNIKVEDIMTPKRVMMSANQERTLKDFYEKNKTLRFSRIPVFDKKEDDITGIILKDDLYQQIIEGNENKTLAEIKKPNIVIENTIPLPRAFDQLTQQRSHIAVVVDKYGSVVGLVTMEDVFETLLGLEIVDESDAVADLQKLARDRWRERAKKIGIIDDEA